ncbi:hypothetical protein C8Q74DRAFT_1215676 [Fomes fomentarius]|nr:hypothetical protein C8Q74DRAFT_1215676 [Fomes fomentarius]
MCQVPIFTDMIAGFSVWARRRDDVNKTKHCSIGKPSRWETANFEVVYEADRRMYGHCVPVLISDNVDGSDEAQWKQEAGGYGWREMSGREMQHASGLLYSKKPETAKGAGERDAGFVREEGWDKSWEEKTGRRSSHRFTGSSSSSLLPNSHRELEGMEAAVNGTLKMKMRSRHRVVLTPWTLELTPSSDLPHWPAAHTGARRIYANSTDSRRGQPVAVGTDQIVPRLDTSMFGFVLSAVELIPCPPFPRPIYTATSSDLKVAI